MTNARELRKGWTAFDRLLADENAARQTKKPTQGTRRRQRRKARLAARRVRQKEGIAGFIESRRLNEEFKGIVGH
jgi:hypothetical protein